MLYDSLTLAEAEREFERLDFELESLQKAAIKPELQEELKQLLERLRLRIQSLKERR
jgi:hypothetical protein